jgi:PIN domain nuclease of toxin-antitoxin system
MDVVLDSSALLAVLKQEPGADLVRARMPGAAISAVNYAEVISKLIDHGMPPDAAAETAMAALLEVSALDQDLAAAAGMLRADTRGAALSLGDRACLALAAHLGAPALTADRAWAQVDVDVEIVLIR